MNSLTAEKSIFIRRHRALLVLSAAMLVLSPPLIFKTISYTRTTALDDIREASSHTLNLVMENLRGELARYRALPHLLASDPTYRKLWDPEKTPSDERAVNLLLEKNRNITGALDLYIMDRNGLTIAASNWQSKRTFIGKNFGFRPYFQQAMQGSLGRYFALGTTSLERGYYFSWPIRQQGKILGVMVCKIRVGQFETGWQTGKNEIIVTDRDGIIFLSSKPQWLFHSLMPLDATSLKRIRADRQYDKAILRPLDIVARKPLDAHASLITLQQMRAPNTQIRKAKNQRRRFGQTVEYLQIGRDMKTAGWQVHILAATNSIRTRIWRNVLVLLALLFGFFTGAALLLERLRRNRELIALQSGARIELEQRVEERTRELKKTQRELIQAGKLAALGKLSAGLSHELNQPLAAIRSYADNADIFLQRGETEPARSNLKNIGELIDRMARIIRHLRTYASKERVEASPTDLVAAVREALVLLHHRIKTQEAEIIDHLPEKAIIVHGGLVRLQQVFVNIISNALDAIAEQMHGRVVLELEETADKYIVIIRDNGTGLSSAELDRVFDPFYSTKDVGEGVGLGLSISYGIITQFGGRISVANVPGGGAIFRVALPKPDLPEKIPAPDHEYETGHKSAGEDIANV